MWKELQRIVSRTEPELGLGAVIRVSEDGFIEVHFSRAGEVRRYSAKNAPLHRFKLRTGQKVYLPGGKIVEILDSIEDEVTGLVRYSHSEGAVWEYELEDRVHDQGALELFFGGHFSRSSSYDLRRDARRIRADRDAKECQGLIGPRVAPLPHQLYIARTVSRRIFPRVLLADEVGLGKTIEAGLIFSSLRARGRAKRVLIVAPESLVHQWVAEMFRRFNQVFSVVDETRCVTDRKTSNLSAFEANQHVIVSMDFLQKNAARLKELLEYQWDLVIIDEAHHLRWDEDAPDIKWNIAKLLSVRTPGLLLLTATPQQYGLPTQFGLLNLVDPDRFANFEQFVIEHERHREVADLATLISRDGMTEGVRATLERLFAFDNALIALAQDPSVSPTKVLGALIDRHGTGRVLFRNRRERLKGFPKRILHSLPLEQNRAVKQRLDDLSGLEDELLVMDLATGRCNKRLEALPWSKNPKFSWLIAHLAKSSQEKCLIMCSSVEGVTKLQECLDDEGFAVAVFHEELSVVERDKEAARFAMPDGVNLLVCSEIGGEGRNFQFAHQLIFMDLPKHPDLVEQRIGRLDRIGQKKDVQIYVPWLKSTPEEALFRWYHEGLDAFCSSWNGAAVILNEFIDDIFQSLFAFVPGNANSDRANALLVQLIKDSKAFAQSVREENKRSIDLLVDLNSFDEKQGLALQEEIEDADDDTSVEFFMRSFFDYYGVDYEEYDDRGSIVVKPDSLMFVDKLPGLDLEEDCVMTFDREMGLRREDMLYLTADHPIVEESLSMLIERNEGVASVCKWEHSPYGNGALIEFSIVLEAIGPESLELTRFLPASIHELTYTHDGKRVKEKRHKKETAVLSEVSDVEMQGTLPRLHQILDPIVARCHDKATRWAEDKIDHAIAKAEHHLGEELRRLKELSEINPLVSDREIKAFDQRLQATIDCLSKATPRIDAVRLIFTR